VAPAAKENGRVSSAGSLALSGAHEQIRVQMIRELVQLQADRARRQVGALGGLGDAGTFRDQHEQFELPDVHKLRNEDRANRVRPSGSASAYWTNSPGETLPRAPEELHCTLVLFRRFARWKRPQVPAPAGFRIFFP
jgi:hypothetical protein